MGRLDVEIKVIINRVLGKPFLPLLEFLHQLHVVSLLIFIPVRLS